MQISTTGNFRLQLLSTYFCAPPLSKTPFLPEAQREGNRRRGGEATPWSPNAPIHRTANDFGAAHVNALGRPDGECKILATSLVDTNDGVERLGGHAQSYI